LPTGSEFRVSTAMDRFFGLTLGLACVVATVVLFLVTLGFWRP
jgi:hypothetical protein